ncbi:MAG: TetM/TetW/TetO/TetS family tetracycline resistance ribosomal protection protein [Bacteroidales bacterium]|jgi:ribosomal protection tetracycline resistance protein|nr:TetM/TetW/TetO/TetS family tetracycline resistance ribosomal protection protein [Bacteroidales bacterium]
MNPNIRNIGILAHVDAGKTTITENFLFLSGATKQLGRVDAGTTQTDFLDVERERGISVRSSITTFVWEETKINLIDTPGHVDFSADVERILRVLDCAILVISAVEGVQAHTETLWNALLNLNIPTIIFINKIDRVGSDVDLVVKEIKKELADKLAVIYNVSREASSDVRIESIWNETNINDSILEAIANTDEVILEKYLDEEKLTFLELDNSFVKAVHNCNLFPVLMGSGKNTLGIKELLNASLHYFPAPKANTTGALSAFVFKLTHDKTMGAIAHVKIYCGVIKNREVIKNASQNIEEKITQVRKLISNKFEDISEAKAGDIVGIWGLKNTRVGDVLGEFTKVLPDEVSLRTPLLTVQVKPARPAGGAENDKDYPALAVALQILSKEDPSLDFEWLREDKELHVKIMGWIQIEVLERILENRFNIKAKFDDPTVIYKETPAKKGEGFVQYWMPKPCWAIMKFIIEPGERGSGVVYESKISVDDVQRKYQNEVERTIPKALKQGIKGWEVTDLKITLIEGEDHQVHSNPGDFIVATPMGIMNGLVKAGTTLLEPLISFKISAIEDLLGAITSDITQMRGSFDSPEMGNEKFILTGILPVATSLDFPVRLSSRSGGKAKISTKFHGYQECTDELGQKREYKGISPLDTSKWILKARKALQ